MKDKIIVFLLFLASLIMIIGCVLLTIGKALIFTTPKVYLLGILLIFIGFIILLIEKLI